MEIVACHHEAGRGSCLCLPFYLSVRHRAFLVNIRMVVKIDGNSQGYKLNLEGCEEDVPVSRAYAKEVKSID